jgi:CRISPR-associated protein Cas1
MLNLRSRFLNPTNFQLAWEKVAANQGCAGVDGETIAHFAQHQNEYLKDLRDAIADGSYRPLPLRQIFIPKKNGGWRELGVPTVRDRIVQQALLNILHPIMEREFEPCSFAYRPGRSHLMAVQKIAYWRDRGYEWVLDGDIIEYFRNIQHSRLLAEVAERLNQTQFLQLIEDWISVGVLTKEGLVLPEKGIPQGAVIAPILANIYLDDFDEILSAADLKPIRYADDFLLLARTQKRLERAFVEVAQILSGMGLQLHPDKTRLTNFDKGFRFLGQVFAGDLIIPMQKSVEKPLPPVGNEDELRLVHAEKIIQPTALQVAMVEALKASHKPIPPPLFVVFGYSVRQEKSIPIESKEIPWIAEMATIYLVEQGTTIRREHGRFLLQSPKKTEIEVPIREVERILVFGNIQLTTTVISTCLSR